MLVKIRSWISRNLDFQKAQLDFEFRKPTWNDFFSSKMLWKRFNINLFFMEKATKAAFTLNGREIYVSVFYSISLFLLFSLKQIHFRPFSVTNDIKIFAIRLDAKRKKRRSQFGDAEIWSKMRLVYEGLWLKLPVKCFMSSVSSIESYQQV